MTSFYKYILQIAGDFLRNFCELEKFLSAKAAPSFPHLLAGAVVPATLVVTFVPTKVTATPVLFGGMENMPNLSAWSFHYQTVNYSVRKTAHTAKIL